jgi:O-acetylhomoserine/O-acetylserine sulfhydrylase-like pyridoxal-dependent enzyme
MGATDAVIKLLRPGDEVITGDDLYGGSYRMFTKIFEPYGIKFHFINMTDAANVAKYVNEKTKLIWIGNAYQSYHADSRYSSSFCALQKNTICCWP